MGLQARCDTLVPAPHAEGNELPELRHIKETDLFGGAQTSMSAKAGFVRLVSVSGDLMIHLAGLP